MSAWLWFLVALTVAAVNVFLAINDATVLPALFHYALAAVAFLFGLGVILATRMQDKAYANLKRRGFSDEAIERIAASKDTEAQILMEIAIRDRQNA